ncbi:hypothetical protein M1563_03285 [Patescibacteria group bacterium]|nr:hypothetical protein [Patescibacteria group bacterium]MCL5409231.1 hypothetical protein [Patescibacteria group bacterium]
MIHYLTRVDRKIILVGLVILLALFVRLFNFENRINFGPEQAISLTVAGNNLTDKFSLLGLPYYRSTDTGYNLFASPIFTWSLIPLQLLFDFDPVFITAFFAILNVVTGLILLLVVRKMGGFLLAFFSMVLFLFNAWMIYHSEFIWILNWSPLLGILTIYLLYLARHKTSGWHAFWLGLIGAIGFGLDYPYLFTAGLSFFILLFWSKKKLMTGIIFLLGAMLGDLPMLIFDFKHNFYNLVTLWQYTQETWQNPGQSHISYYHFLQFWPLGALVVAWLLLKIFHSHKWLVTLVVASYIIINLISPQVSFTQAVGMKPGFHFDQFNQAAANIAADNPQNFNVASLIDFDSRANPLRYLLKFRYHQIPEGIEEYPQARTLYVLAESGYDFDRAIAWEVTSYQPFKVQQLTKVPGGYEVYKLTK